MTDINRTTSELKRNRLDFIKVELEFVRTFCKLSKETGAPEIRTGTIANAAQRSFQAAVKSFIDFSEQTEDWRKAKTLLDDVANELLFTKLKLGMPPPPKLVPKNL